MQIWIKLDGEHSWTKIFMQRREGGNLGLYGSDLKQEIEHGWEKVIMQGGGGLGGEMSNLLRQKQRLIKINKGVANGQWLRGALEGKFCNHK